MERLWVPGPSVRGSASNFSVQVWWVVLVRQMQSTSRRVVPKRIWILPNGSGGSTLITTILTGPEGGGRERGGSTLIKGLRWVESVGGAKWRRMDKVKTANVSGSTLVTQRGAELGEGPS